MGATPLIAGMGAFTETCPSPSEDAISKLMNKVEPTAFQLT
jgi:hypothetical protein